jgi:hypothetical protein
MAWDDKKINKMREDYNTSQAARDQVERSLKAARDDDDVDGVRHYSRVLSWMKGRK